MLRPVNYKYKKMHKPCVKNCILDFKNTSLTKGIYGIKALESGRISSKELESVKKLISKRIKKRGKVTFCVFPDHFTSKKPLEVRMGKGKGGLHEWVALITKGTVILEVVMDDGLQVFNKKVLLECCGRISLSSKVIKYSV